MKTQAAGRRTSVSPQRRASQWALAAGGVLAIAAAIGPVWVVRVGVIVALIAGGLAVRWAWQELRQGREEAGRKQLADLRSHNAQLSTERQRNRDVLETLQRHDEANAEKLVALQVTIGHLRTEISSLNGDKGALRDDVKKRDRRIAELTATLADREAELADREAELADREAELAELWAESGEAEIVTIPRHAATTADWDALPSAEDLWANGNHPTVVDLQKLAYPPVVEPRRRQA